MTVKWSIRSMIRIFGGSAAPDELWIKEKVYMYS